MDAHTAAAESHQQSRAEDHLAALIEMSREIGDPRNDYVIASEGNTSVRLDDGTCWIKASGSKLDGIGASDFVHLRLEPLLDLVADPTAVSAAPVDDVLRGALVSGSPPDRQPSIETFVHAVALGVAGARYVAHTHPTPVTGLLCSVAARSSFEAAVFPDEVVVCGRAPLFVPYFEPGLPLGRALRERLLEHSDRYGEPPRIVLLGNHGLVAFGRSPAEAVTATAMLVKAARVRAVALAAGGIAPLTDATIEELAGRTDEARRAGLLFSAPVSQREAGDARDT
jgi:rhamnose utilization protein RhaD (predicted bifunctional aldolase and dehydrogenase)